ncbi:MAG: hypothetical protein LUC48_05205 [Clostridiales bacterium]|nr:hypothetical protein [Clostridiales bacterium]
MKYMTFPSSCAFAGVANLLAFAGVDASDREIALGMGLPYLFAKSEQGGYLSGPMMQTGELFDLFLRPRGFRLAEQRAEPSAVPGLLAHHAPAMVGLRLDADRKHAVIYTGRDGEGRYRLLNNKREDAPDCDRFLFTEEEFLARLDAPVTVGWLEVVPCADVALLPHLTVSIQVFQEMRDELRTFCGAAHTWAELRQARDPLFRPLLLDGVSMANLLGESALEEALRELQSAFLAALRRGQAVAAGELLPVPQLEAAMEVYFRLLVEKQEALCPGMEKQTIKSEWNGGSL